MPVRDRRGEHGGDRRQRCTTCRQPFRRGLKPPHGERGRIGQIDWTGYQGDARAQRRKRFGNRKTLAAAAAIGKVAHRVNWLVRGAGGYQNVAAGKRSSPEKRVNSGNDGRWLGEAAGA